jgi:hypothetical protein
MKTGKPDRESGFPVFMSQVSLNLLIQSVVGCMFRPTGTFYETSLGS